MARNWNRGGRGQWYNNWDYGPWIFKIRALSVINIKFPNYFTIYFMILIWRNIFINELLLNIAILSRLLYVIPKLYGLYTFLPHTQDTHSYKLLSSEIFGSDNGVARKSWDKWKARASTVVSHGHHTTSFTESVSYSTQLSSTNNTISCIFSHTHCTFAWEKLFIVSYLLHSPNRNNNANEIQVSPCKLGGCLLFFQSETKGSPLPFPIGDILNANKISAVCHSIRFTCSKHTPRVFWCFVFVVCCVFIVRQNTA